MQFIQSHLESLHYAGKSDIFRFNYRLQMGEFVNSTEPRPPIPDTELFRTLTLENANSLPTVAECAVHLELLEAFYTMRIQVMQSTELDEFFDIESPEKRTVYRRKYLLQKHRYERVPVQLRDDEFATRREKKWDCFLTIAVTRFIHWAREANKTLVAGQSSPNSNEERSGNVADSLDFPFLPPLGISTLFCCWGKADAYPDVLMVWHAFLLNPLDFQEYCEQNNLGAVRKLKFPWSRIVRQARGPGHSN